MPQPISAYFIFTLQQTDVIISLFYTVDTNVFSLSIIILIMTSTIKRHRIYLVDIIRILCALLIFMRHSITMYGCSYGSNSIDQGIVALTSPVMSMFFILSGFSINYSSCSNEEWDYHKTHQFYVKRMIQIVPTYLLIHCLWLIFGSDSFIRWIFLTPFELLSLQSMYPNIFGILHNGGTWFISCLIMAYLLYPACRCILFNLSEKGVYKLTLFMMILLVYLPAIGYYYALGDTYSNPVFRCLEFAFGVLISDSALSSANHFDDKKNQALKNLIGLLLCSAGFILQIYLLTHPIVLGNARLNISSAHLYMYPFFVLLLFLGSIMRSEMLERNNVLRYMSGLIYYFFILQLILWTITDAVTAFLNDVVGINLSSNLGKIMLSFTVCLTLSIAVHELFDKPIKSFLFKRLPVFDNHKK